jgi:GDPmannose 4,6-dehydratase
MKRVIIVGSGGQDGGILFDRLSREGCSVLGVERHILRSTAPIELKAVNILRRSDVSTLLESFLPDAIYYLAAFHQSSEERQPSDEEAFERGMAVNVLGLLNFLESIHLKSASSRLFYAASSHVFGETMTELQDETTPLRPACPYGITKATGLHCCRYFRRKHGLFVATGILFNHESIYRKSSFVSKRIIQGAVEIKKGRRSKLVLGNLSSLIDWGYAPDYVEAMLRILQLDRPDDFVIATGEIHSVREFVELAFEELGLKWENYVEEDPETTYKPNRVLIGNAIKLRKLTGWKPSKTFEQMVRCLVREEESAN